MSLTTQAFGLEFYNKVIKWIQGNLSPEDVFDNDTLEDWAYAKGFIKEEDCEVARDGTY